MIELGRHKRAALLFSGGKESVVLAHMLESQRDRIELVWVNTGAMLPHMVAFVRGYGQRWRLTELRSDQPGRLRTVGLPSPVVPVFNTPMGGTLEREPRNRPMLTDAYTCCSALRGKPVEDYLRAEGITLLIHGQRHADNVVLGWSCPTGEVLAPLWDWSEDQVFAYVERHSLALPFQYPALPDSMECWNCTAELGANRIRWMKRHYPQRMPELRRMIGTVSAAVEAAIQKAAPGVEEALAGGSDAPPNH